ncbi:MAG: phosphomannomutase/phosphoglucomutase, partial [Candidatus Limiplasma sp.]|nr:phosphomannomutase/phosphoglucomutase [Candidatus Limiplasma sp.]
QKPLLGLHVVVDAGNGAGGFYANMLEELGAWIEGSQFLEPDGHFPNHIPNPENPDAMASISAAVKRVGADLGVIFDADCDRAAIVDHSGKEINRNRLIAVISAILLEDMPGATIVTDSVTSSGLSDFIKEWGGEHYRYKRGYRNVIDEAQRLNAAGINCPLAIETSGHAALRDNHFLDDGMYLVTVLLIKAMQMKQQGETLSHLLDGLREPVESMEIRLPVTCDDFAACARNAIEHVLDYASGREDWHIAPDNREGVRISFDEGGELNSAWFLLRLSVHDPVMPLNAESDVPGGVKAVLAKLYEALQDQKGIDLSPLKAAL